MRNLEEMNGKHNGTICFVIGAGPSIHYQDLTPLKKCVTIAVNSGYVAAPWATYFLSDDWSVQAWSFFEDLQRSNTTVLLYEGMFKGAQKTFGNRTVFFRHRTKYHITDKYVHNDYENNICQGRSSTSTAIHVAHIMGCSKIVLVGVDCCRIQNYRYFWQFPGFKNPPHRKDRVPVDGYYKCNFEGKQSDHDLVDILSYWRTKGPKMLEKCDIYNASPVSTLKVFPKVDLEEFIESEIKNAQ